MLGIVFFNIYNKVKKPSEQRINLIFSKIDKNTKKRWKRIIKASLFAILILFVNELTDFRMLPIATEHAKAFAALSGLSISVSCLIFLTSSKSKESAMNILRHNFSRMNAEQKDRWDKLHSKLLDGEL